MDSTEKLVRAAKLATKHLPANLRADFEALFAPSAIAITTGVLAGWAAAHAFGIGLVADLLLVLVGFVTLGFVALQAVDEIGSYVTGAMSAATEEDLDRAGAHLAKAVTLLGVQVFVALVTRGMAKRVQSPALYQARVARIERVLASVGTKHRIPEIRQRMVTALAFFDESFPKMSEQDLLSRLRAIDFSQPVDVIELPAGTRLAAFKNTEFVLHPTDPTKLLSGAYYTKPGTPPDRLGIATNDLTMVRYETTRAVKVLRSRAGPTMDRWSVGRTPTFGSVSTAGGRSDSGEMVAGGGVQYVLPSASDALRLVGLDTLRR